MKEQVMQALRKVGRLTGFIPTDVEFGTLARDPARFQNRLIQTTGMYHPVSRRVKSESDWVTGASMLPDVRVERHKVAEQGVMIDPNGRLAVRVYREFNFG